VHHNSWGFREQEFEMSKPRGVYRIAVIGDSFTYGQGIPEEDRFTELMEKFLNDQMKKYEVLNFGRGGAQTVDEVATLRNIVLRMNPDFILLQWFVNDFEGKILHRTHFSTKW
jgi:lysophospholipase L1-like esterase